MCESRALNSSGAQRPVLSMIFDWALRRYKRQGEKLESVTGWLFFSLGKSQVQPFRTFPVIFVMPSLSPAYTLFFNYHQSYIEIHIKIL